jgi:DNA-binding Lrp family transcriptional regulator
MANSVHASRSSDHIARSEPSVRPDHPRVDAVDRSILAELTRSGRLSVRELAERIHLSRAQTYVRLDRLVGDGVITGFGAKLDPEAAGLATSAYVMVAIEQNSWREVAAQLQQIPYVEHLALVGGEFDVLVLVRAPDNASLRHVVLDRIQETRGVRSTRTALLFEELDGPGGFGGVDDPRPAGPGRADARRRPVSSPRSGAGAALERP